MLLYIEIIQRTMRSGEVVVIGAGFSGLATAALLAKDGFNVTVIEKNEQPGGRASVWKEGGWFYLRYGSLMVSDARCL